MGWRHALLTVMVGSLGLLAGCVLPGSKRPADEVKVPVPSPSVGLRPGDTPYLARTVNPDRKVDAPPPPSERVTSPEPAPPPLSPQGAVEPTATVGEGTTPATPATLVTVVPAPVPGPPPEAPLLAALRALLDRQPNAALKALDKFDRETQDLLLALLPLAARLGDGKLGQASADELAAMLEQLDALAASLRPRAPLVLENPCFCRKISGFGVYDPLPPLHPFQAGLDGLPGERVLVYVEVRNFTSVPRGAFFETRLASTLEILDFQGRPVAPPMELNRPDRSYSPRHDYFIRFEFHVPPRLPPGDYVLRIELRDDLRRAAAGPADRNVKAAPVVRKSLDFRVVGPALGQ